MGGRNPEFYVRRVHAGMRKYQTSTLGKRNATILNSSLQIKTSQNEWKQNASLCCFYKTQPKPNITKK